jgi:transposase
MKIATPEIRSIVVKAYRSGIASRRQLADIFNYHIETIGRWIRASRQERFAPLPRGHRRSVFSREELEQLGVYIENNPDATLNELRERFGKKCSLPALHKITRKIGYVFKKNFEGERARTRGHSQQSRRMAEVPESN